MRKYSYDGAVMMFNTCVNNHYHAETMANTESKARANMIFAWKKQNGYEPTVKVIFPGKVVVEEELN